MIHWFCPNGDIWVCGLWCVHMTGSIVIDREGRTLLFHPELVLPETTLQMKRQTKIISPCHGTRFPCTRIFICLKSRRWQGVLKVGSGLYAGTRPGPGRIQFRFPVRSRPALFKILNIPKLRHNPAISRSNNSGVFSFKIGSLHLYPQ